MIRMGYRLYSSYIVFNCNMYIPSYTNDTHRVTMQIYSATPEGLLSAKFIQMFHQIVSIVHVHINPLDI